MNQLAMLLAVLLALVGVVHLVWAVGLTWPCKDEKTLARTVVGSRDIERMPPRLASVFVAICLFGASLWALALRDLGPITFPQIPTFIGGAALATIFGLRGIFGVLPTFEKMTPEQPFLTLNRRLYSPLCLAIGASFALLTLSMPNWGWRLAG